MRREALMALSRGLSLASGLHTRLADDHELRAACRDDRWIWDLRCEPEQLQVAQARAAALPRQRVLAVGTDMAVGKMSACLELLKTAQQRSLPCRFVGTGQAGILIGGSGVALDAVRVDYAAGAVEAAVIKAAESLPAHGLVLRRGRGRCAIQLPVPPCRCCAAASPRHFYWYTGPGRTRLSGCQAFHCRRCLSWWR